jgi:hypothetical protein
MIKARRCSHSECLRKFGGDEGLDDGICKLYKDMRMMLVRTYGLDGKIDRGICRRHISCFPALKLVCPTKLLLIRDNACSVIDGT